MKNLKTICALILIAFFSSCNEESLIEGRLPVEVVDDGQQADNVTFTVDGINYSGGALALDYQTSSACSNFIVAYSYNSTSTRGIEIVNYQHTSTTIFDFLLLPNPCTQMRINVQIDGTSYLSKSGTYSVSGNIFTLNCTAVEQSQFSQVGAPIHFITATGKII